MLVGISIYVYINFFIEVAYAMGPSRRIMQGSTGWLYITDFDLFKENFMKAMDICAGEINKGPVTYQEIMSKQHCFMQNNNHHILNFALDCKCNQPNLGWGSTAFTKGTDGQITQSATLTKLLD